jgi:hypothetical protein
VASTRCNLYFRSSGLLVFWLSGFLVFCVAKLDPQEPDQLTVEASLTEYSVGYFLCEFSSTLAFEQ